MLLYMFKMIIQNIYMFKHKNSTVMYLRDITLTKELFLHFLAIFSNLVLNRLYKRCNWYFVTLRNEKLHGIQYHLLISWAYTFPDRQNRSRPRTTFQRTQIRRTTIQTATICTICMKTKTKLFSLIDQIF